MENFVLPKIDHNQDSLHKAFGLSFYDKQVVFNSILFELVSNALLVKELFDNPEEAPINMIAKTGILEKSLAHVTRSPDQVFLLLVFSDIYDAMANSLAKIAAEKPAKKETKDAEGIKSILSKLVDELKSHPIKSAIDAVKKSNYDFDKFLTIVCPKDKCDEIERLEDASQKEGPKGLDLGNILGRLFGSDQEDDD